jgi:hypothetical protein
MEQSHGASGLLLLPVLLLSVAVISVPLARLLRLSTIVAYLAAGVVIGPYGFGLVRAPETIVTVSELGVVLMLFLIGLELEFSRLLALRRAIFGLGATQLALTAAAVAARPHRLARRRHRRVRAGDVGNRHCAEGSWRSAASCNSPMASAPSRSCCSRTCRWCRCWRCCRCSRPAPTATWNSAIP